MTTREKIIDAAMTVVRERGPGQLTLDETARVAGVSKGGVLYHFRSKDDLLRGMVERLGAMFDALFPKIYDSIPQGPYRSARALILTLTHPEGPYGNPVGIAILAAAALNPDLLAPVRHKAEECKMRISEDSPDPDLARIACLSVDGRWMSEVIGMETFSDEDRRRLTARALALLEVGGGA